MPSQKKIKSPNNYAVIHLEGFAEHDLAVVPKKWLEYDNSNNCYVPYISKPITKKKEKELLNLVELGSCPDPSWEKFKCDVIHTDKKRWVAKNYVDKSAELATKIRQRRTSRKLSICSSGRRSDRAPSVLPPSAHIPDDAMVTDEMDFLKVKKKTPEVGEVIQSMSQQRSGKNSLADTSIHELLTQSTSGEGKQNSDITMDTETISDSTERRHRRPSCGSNNDGETNNLEELPLITNEKLRKSPNSNSGVIPDQANHPTGEGETADIQSLGPKISDDILFDFASLPIIDFDNTQMPADQRSNTSFEGETLIELQSGPSEDALKLLYKSADSDPIMLRPQDDIVSQLREMRDSIKRIETQLSNLTSKIEGTIMLAPNMPETEEIAPIDDTLPCKTIEEFEMYGQSLDLNCEHRKFLEHAVEILLFPNSSTTWTLTKSLSMILRRFMTQDLAKQYTGVRSTQKKTKVFIETVFYKHLKGFCLRTLKKYPESTKARNDIEREREFRKATASVIANCKDWDGNRWKSHPPKNQKTQREGHSNLATNKGEVNSRDSENDSGE